MSVAVSGRDDRSRPAGADAAFPRIEIGRKGGALGGSDAPGADVSTRIPFPTTDDESPDCDDLCDGSRWVNSQVVSGTRHGGFRPSNRDPSIERRSLAWTAVSGGAGGRRLPGGFEGEFSTEQRARRRWSGERSLVESHPVDDSPTDGRRRTERPPRRPFAVASPVQAPHVGLSVRLSVIRPFTASHAGVRSVIARVLQTGLCDPATR